MTAATRSSPWAFPVFAFFVLLTLGVAGVIGLITFDVVDLGMTHFGDPEHRVHDVVFGLIFSTAIVGVLAQLRRPAANVAGMAMALVPWVALVVAGALAADVGRVLLRNPSILMMPLVVTTALLHPTGRGFVRILRTSRPNWALLALVAAAAIPLLVLASSNIRLQTTADGMHASMGHYGFMAAFSFTVIGSGVLAGLRPDGWRLPAWATGVLPAVLGLTSLASPVSSSLSPFWALWAIAWGTAFIGTAELTRRAETRSSGHDSAYPSNVGRR